MKIKLLLSALILMFSVSMAYASFPVKRTAAAVDTENVSSTEQINTGELLVPAAASSQKSQGIALVLWFFLGGLAGHRWYLGSPWYWNVLFILTAGGLGVWWIIDLIDILTDNYPTNGGFKSSFF